MTGGGGAVFLMRPSPSLPPTLLISGRRVSDDKLAKEVSGIVQA